MGAVVVLGGGHSVDVHAGLSPGVLGQSGSVEALDAGAVAGAVGAAPGVRGAQPAEGAALTAMVPRLPVVGWA